MTRSIAEEGEDAVLGRNFYRCPNTGEWVYKWADERLVLMLPPENRVYRCDICGAEWTITRGDPISPLPWPDPDGWVCWSSECRRLARFLDRPQRETAEVCRADRDGDCTWSGCPQLRDSEPDATGRHCPLDICVVPHARGDTCDGCRRGTPMTIAAIKAALRGETP